MSPRGIAVHRFTWGFIACGNVVNVREATGNARAMWLFLALSAVAIAWLVDFATWAKGESK
jgi:hypothetical protein